MKDTRIGWCHDTVNLWWGCAEVSQACVRCYARVLAMLFSRGKATWGKDGARWVRIDAALKELVSLNKIAAMTAPRRVFINSMSDTFEDREDLRPARDKFFAIVRDLPHLRLMLLTKRPENILRMVPADWLEAWPENVWVGTTVENQAMADHRIPALLEVPAKLRFLSVEPMLGGIDLDGWGADAALPIEMPQKWSDFEWPNWVTPDQRSQVERFWGDPSRRVPREWNADNIAQHTPRFGAKMGFDSRRWVCKTTDPKAIGSGRFMHAWNNMGRIITDAGEVVGVASSRGPGWMSEWLGKDGKYHHVLHWIICGGESGAGFRELDLEAVGALRDQCLRNNIPFFMKQDSGLKPGKQGRIPDELWIQEVPAA